MKMGSMRNLAFSGTLIALLIGGMGCKQLPGTKGQQGAAIGGLSGAAIGAAVGGSEHRLIGALLGGAIGAGGGYLIGANSDKILNRDSESAREAAQRAERSPATASQARNATTADINNDGFVTMDEIVALDQAGLSDAQMIERLRATDQVFELTQVQQDYLRNHGVSNAVIDELPQINQELKDRLLSQNPGDSVIGKPAPTGR